MICLIHERLCFKCQIVPLSATTNDSFLFFFFFPPSLCFISHHHQHCSYCLLVLISQISPVSPSAPSLVSSLFPLCPVTPLLSYSASFAVLSNSIFSTRIFSQTYTPVPTHTLIFAFSVCPSQVLAARYSLLQDASPCSTSASRFGDTLTFSSLSQVWP